MFSSLPTHNPTKIMKPENWHFGRDHGTLIQPPSRPPLPHPRSIETKNHLFDHGLDDRKPTLENWPITKNRNKKLIHGYRGQWMEFLEVNRSVSRTDYHNDGECWWGGVSLCWGSGPPRGQVKQSLPHYRYLSRSKYCSRRGSRWWVGDSSPSGRRSKVKRPNEPLIDH